MPSARQRTAAAARPLARKRARAARRRSGSMEAWDVGRGTWDVGRDPIGKVRAAQLAALYRDSARDWIVDQRSAGAGTMRARGTRRSKIEQRNRVEHWRRTEPARRKMVVVLQGYSAKVSVCRVAEPVPPSVPYGHACPRPAPAVDARRSARAHRRRAARHAALRARGRRSARDAGAALSAPGGGGAAALRADAIPVGESDRQGAHVAVRGRPRGRIARAAGPVRAAVEGGAAPERGRMAARRVAAAGDRGALTVERPARPSNEAASVSAARARVL